MTAIDLFSTLYGFPHMTRNRNKSTGWKPRSKSCGNIIKSVSEINQQDESPGVNPVVISSSMFQK